ncbi:MAG: methylthioribulose 1-phosphate dehydratase [Panacagrimonas sp.]
MTPQQALAEQMIAIGRLFHQRAWVPATGGNFSARLGSDSLLITASGWHKGELAPQAFLAVDLAGETQQTDKKASYETLLHCQAYRRNPQVGAVLHTHSIANTVLSRRKSVIFLRQYELLKILPGLNTHAAAVAIPVFENDQNIQRLADVVDRHIQSNPMTPAYLIQGHGLYTWGDDLNQARHRVEALEFMFECELHQ